MFSAQKKIKVNKNKIFLNEDFIPLILRRWFKFIPLDESVHCPEPGNVILLQKRTP